MHFNTVTVNIHIVEEKKGKIVKFVPEQWCSAQFDP